MTRRSQSYSDFHYAAKAVLGKDAGRPRRGSAILENSTEIKTELDLVDWFHDIEDDLLDASHNEYT